jgi:hypothetical protein
MNVRDIGMVQSREDFRFALEPGEALRITGHRCGQYLDRDLSFEVRIGGAIDLTHAPHAEQRGDFEWAEARARSKRQL